MLKDRASGWLLLVLSLPTPSTAARMRVWRALKALGCVALRDGAYLLPAGEDRAGSLQEIADDCNREGGVSWRLDVLARDAGEEEAFRQLFDRTQAYADLRKQWRQAHRGVAKLEPAELARLQRRLQRDFEAVKSIDFFPGDAGAETEAAFTTFTRRIASLLSPDEPHEVGRSIARADPEAYRGRTWATRRRPWIDRVASAWLVKRFIDPEATFRWLARPSDCPKSAVGFDFDGAEFTHVGDRVTFETLLASFGLEDDPALMRLGRLVHVLDVGGEPLPEAVGFEAVMTGARERLDDDDALLHEMCGVLDSLHAHFRRSPAPPVS